LSKLRLDNMVLAHAGTNMRDIRWFILAMLVVPLSVRAAKPVDTLKSAYLDRFQHVHIVDTHNRDYQIDGSPAIDLVMAPDHKSVAWSVMYKDKDGNALSEEIRIYQQGRVRPLHCGPASSELAFREGGHHLVLRCASLHFAGLQELYDTHTLQQIGSFPEAEVPLEQRPSWNIDAD
jgi:hypothetical protein